MKRDPNGHFSPTSRAFLRHRTVLATPDVVAAREGRRAPPYRREREEIKKKAEKRVQDLFRRGVEDHFALCKRFKVDPLSAAGVALGLATDDYIEELYIEEQH